MKTKIIAVVVLAVVVLATIYLVNYFSSTNVALIGRSSDGTVSLTIGEPVIIGRT